MAIVKVSDLPVKQTLEKTDRVVGYSTTGGTSLLLGESFIAIQSAAEEAKTSAAASAASAKKSADQAGASVESELKQIAAASSAAQEAISSGKTDALDAIASSKSSAVSAVTAAQTGGTAAITAAQKTAVSAVQAAQSTGVSAVETAQSTATAAISKQANDAASAIADAQKNIDASVDAAAASATAAGKSATAAATSESNAATSATAAGKSQSAAAASASAAKASETNSKASETAAASSASAAKSSETAAASSAGAAKTSETNADKSATAASDSATSAAKTVADAEQAIVDAKTAGVAAVAAQQDTSVKAVQAAKTSGEASINKIADAQADRLSRITEAVVEQESHVIDDASSPQSFAVGNVSHVLVFVDSVLAVEGESYGITGGDTVQFADALPVGTEVTLIKFVSAGAAAITPSYAIDSVLSDTSTNAVQNRIVKSAIEAAVKTALLSAHPVGSIYCSVESTDPATLFGGTWERIKDRFILAAGEAYAAGSTGGEATHTLTTAEMPTHSHRIRLNTESSGGYLPTGGKPRAIKTGETPLSGGASNGTFTDRSQSADIGFASDFIFSEGGSAAHNNMPPYMTAYCWRRTA